jgi:hypothetical protein
LGEAALFDDLDRQRRVDLVEGLRHLTLGRSVQALIARLTGALLHSFIAADRCLAAHSPTERAGLQTANIAQRIMRGGELHQSTTA